MCKGLYIYQNQINHSSGRLGDLNIILGVWSVFTSISYILNE
jgi:hypothetical protein